MIKKISTSILLTGALAATMLFAQSPTGGPNSAQPNSAQRVQRHVSRLTMVLNLSSDQQRQATTIFSNAAASNAAVRANMKTARQNLAAAVKTNDTSAITQSSNTIGNLTSQMVTTNAEARAAFLKLLTPDQAAKYEQVASQARNRFRGRRAGSNFGKNTQ